ncbi:LprI domain-containing protein [Paraburkholderia tropica]|uniref:lysozyme inhibitor LprI family protein n=1 Tax=Paraburkholderia tropica TaxID=92647 RepID=UPI001CB1E44E|nr:lysozyme inhibitor LprI family protein [Paraburkholderia tropica]CAG9238915.1 LprI domain-containing protein [Paraburkholderia tropica]
MKYPIAAMAMLLCTTHTYAASFDCEKAASSVEKAICADSSLNALDEQLAQQYRETLGNLPADEAATARSVQRNWLRERDACAAQAAGARDCLKSSMERRMTALQALGNGGSKALDSAIAEIPSKPADAATRLRAYRGGLASAWLVYLHQFEPSSGVSAAEAQARQKLAVAALSDDEFSQSVLADVEKDPKTSRDQKVLTLLRMQIERADYGGDRPYVHCFVFARQGDAAYDAMGPLYGSTRDGSAPVCQPTGNLFEQPAWKRLDDAFGPLMEAIGTQGGTIRYASYASFAVLRLRATLSPRDFLKPALRKDANDPSNELRRWTDNKDWPNAQRQAALKALPDALAATAQWLHTQRGLTEQEAQQAARAIVFGWVNGWIGLAGDSLEASGS